MLTAVKEVLTWHDLLFLDDPYQNWVVYFLALIHSCNAERSKEICRRFELAPEYRKILCVERFDAENCVLWLERNLPLADSELYRKLNGFRTEPILYMMAVARLQKVKKAISHFFTNLRRVEISLKGRDLKEMQLSPGPIYRHILQAALDAKLDGKLKTKTDEIEFARNYLKNHCS
jgi:tRNA nucleotidyltransferase (CCA-adding enzyme)